MTSLESLGALVLATCPMGSTEATLRAELDADYAEIDLRCRSADGAEIRSELPGVSGPDLHDLLDSIREEMAVASGERWETCVFYVTGDGRFRLDVSYPEKR